MKLSGPPRNSVQSGFDFPSGVLRLLLHTDLAVLTKATVQVAAGKENSARTAAAN